MKADNCGNRRRVLYITLLYFVENNELEVLRFSNLNWTDIITPIKPQKLRELLRKSNYPEDETNYLFKGFTEGFDIGYRGPTRRRHKSANLPFRVGSHTELWNKVMKEVKEGRYAGPFEEPPSEYYVQSPLGLVPKAGGKTRLIFHLSYDFPVRDTDEPEFSKSINHHTPVELCSVKYHDLNHAIKQCLELLKMSADMVGASTSTIYYTKTDCSNAFRLAPVLVEQHIYLMMAAVDPVTNKTYYFIEKCLPFGSSRSCAIFQAFSDALAHLARFRIAVEKQLTKCPALTNYLDDFIFMALRVYLCNMMMQAFLDLCQEINCPISDEKTEWGASMMIFLGMLLNGHQHMISIPVEKITKTVNLLNLAIQKRKVSIKFVQQLTGTLNFLNRAIVPGRAFTRGMYAKLKLKNKNGELLKPHHHVYLNNNFMQDCHVWLFFLRNSHNSHLCRPFTDFDLNNQKQDVLRLASDASLAENLGFGAIFNDNWTVGQWNPTFIWTCKPSIEFLELYALTVALTIWRQDPDLRDGAKVVFCNNEVVVHMVNNLASSCMQCLKLIRVIALQGITCNRESESSLCKI